MATGRLCGDARYFVVRCARPGAARDAADALRGVPGAAAAIRRAGGVGEEPVPLCAAVAGARASRRVLSCIGRRRFRGPRPRAGPRGLARRGRAAGAGARGARACWAVRDALLYDPRPSSPSPAKAASGRMSPVPAAPGRAGGAVAAEESAARAGRPAATTAGRRQHKASSTSTTRGRDPGPCAIARALSQLQSSVAPRRTVHGACDIPPCAAPWDGQRVSRLAGRRSGRLAGRHPRKPRTWLLGFSSAVVRASKGVLCCPPNAGAHISADGTPSHHLVGRRFQLVRSLRPNAPLTTRCLRVRPGAAATARS